MKTHRFNVEDIKKQNGDTPFLTFCRKLIKEGNDPNDSAEMYRNGILFLSTKNIGEAAKLTVKEEPYTRFVKYRKLPAYFIGQEEGTTPPRIALKGIT